MKNNKIYIFLFIISVLSYIEISACTTFCINDKYGNIFFGRNYDWSTGLGHVQINLRNIEKTSFISSHEKPFSWVSKYGSITFNQYGREFPCGGMNEAGLVIEEMMNGQTSYPLPDKRYGLRELQWIQYQLDASASVEDVIKSDKIVRISNESIAPIHFSVSDASGNFAIIEYLNGKMSYRTGSKMKYRVLANENYKTGMYFKKKYDSDKVQFADQRFVIAACMIDSLEKDKELKVENAFDILKAVSEDRTKWSIVYDLKNKSIYYKTAKNNNIRKLELKQFDFSNTSERLFVDIDDNYCSVSDFQIYSFEKNYQLIETVSKLDDGTTIDIPYKKELSLYNDDLTNKNNRKIRISAAIKIVDLLRVSNYETKKTEIEKIINSKEDFYFSETEFYIQVYTKLQIANRAKQAVDAYKILVVLYPNSAKAYTQLALAYKNAGNQKLTIDNLEKSLAIDPNNHDAKWEFETLKALGDPLVLDEITQKSYVGVYGPRTISFKKDQLYYQREGKEKMKMIAMAKDLFVFKEIDYFRLKIISENGKAIAVEGIYTTLQNDRNERTK